jgi:WD40 repeat protein
LRELVGHTDWVTDIAVAPDGHTLLSGGRDRRLILWESEASQELGKVLLHKETTVYNDVAISPDDKLLAAGTCTKTAEDGYHCLKGEVQLRNLITESVAGILHVPIEAVESVAFSPNRQTNILATGGCGALDAEGNCQTGEIRLWDPVTQQLLGDPLQGHTNSVHTLVFSLDGSKLASGGADGTVILWDVSARRPLTSPLFADSNFVTSVTFNADGSLLAASGGDSYITLWNTTSGQRKDSFQLTNSSGVVVVAFSPDRGEISTSTDSLGSK